MDINTGVPIQNPSTQLPPIPQASPTLPSFLDPTATLPTTSPSLASDPMTVPEVSSNLSNLPPLENVEKSAVFIDTLSALRNLSDKPEASTSSEISPVNSVMPEAAPLDVVETPAENVITRIETPQIVVEKPVEASIIETPVPQPIAPQTPLPPDAVMANPVPLGNIPVQGTYNTLKLLDLVVEKEASDLHLVVGYPPMLRIDGDLVTVGTQILDPQMAKELIYAILPDDKKEQLEVNREVDLAYQHASAGRFRINAYWQRGYLSAAFRLIPTRIRTIDELKLPDLFHKFSDMEQGLVLVTGPTGHGKSTTLASVIQEINMKHPKHILTIEDPIEYVFPQIKALVSQRELGDDTHSWKGALRSALREDPDVVLVGEMRDLETISAAITVAETGHLVFATLHTNSAAQTVQRIVNMYPDVQQEEIRTELADVLEAVVAQRLIPIKGGGRRAALEVMIMTPAIRNLIRENKVYQIDNVIRTSMDIGMITLERSLLTFFREGLISQEDALRYALDATEMARLLEELV